MKRAIIRPAIPVLVWCCAGMWVGIACAEWCAWHSLLKGVRYPLGAGVVPLVFAMVTAVVHCVRLRRRAVQGIAGLLVTAVLIGFGLGGVRWMQWHTTYLGIDVADGVTGTVLRDPVAGRIGTQVLVELDGGAGATVRVMLREGAIPPRAAARVEIRGSPQRFAPQDDWARRAHRRGEVASMRVREVGESGWDSSLRGVMAPVRERVRGLCAAVPGNGGDVLLGVLIGDRSRVRGSVFEDDLRICGLSHLLAVSGTHLGILAMAAGSMARLARAGVAARTLCVCTVGIAYVLLSGVQTSAVRALVMGGVAGVAGASSRRTDALSALAVACAGMLALEPAVAFDIGFQLSVSAVGGLVLFGPLVSGWLQGMSGRRLSSIATMVAATLVAQAATAPVAIPAFGMFSLVAPVANVAAVPLLTIGLGVGVLGGVLGLALPALGILVLRAASVPLYLVGVVASWCSRLPGAALGLGWNGAGVALLVMLAGVVLWWRWPLPRARRDAVAIALAALAMCALVMVGTPVSDSDASLTVLDVGQGDAILVRDGRAVMLVDTGADPGVLRSALTRHGVRTLRAVILTHDHADHTAGLPGLVGLCSVDRVFVPAVAEEDAFSSCTETMVRLGLAPRGDPLHAGDMLDLGRTRITVLWPADPSRASSTNDTSMVLLLERDGFSALLTGDAEEAALAGALAHGDPRPVDVLKVPHHGSSNGLTREALDAWRPRIAVVSVGEGNSHGHPHPSVLAMLTASGARVLRTDRAGDVRISIAGSGYRVETSTTMTSDVAYGTIAKPVVHSTGRSSAGHTRPEDHGNHRTIRPQTGVSHLRSRGPPVGPGGQAAEGSAGISRGPRLQPNSL